MTDEIYHLIEQFDTITIFGHVYPDGDCYGSQIGLREALRATFPEKKVYALGSGFRSFLDRIGPMDQVDDSVIAGSLAIIVDVGNTARIEDQRYASARMTVKIDHHVPDGSWADLEWIEKDALAVCDMIAGFVIEHHLKISVSGANALCLGLVTDTGRFQFGSVGASTFTRMAFLLDQGANLASIYEVLYSVDERDLRLRGFISMNFSKTSNGVAFMVINKETVEAYQVFAHKAANMVNAIANVKGCPIWVIFADDGKDIYVEMRCIEGYNIQPVARQFGGGGHENAAGCTLTSLDVVPQVLEALGNVVLQGRH